MNIDLDVSVLESTALAYKAASESFTAERDFVRAQPVALAAGWSGDSYLAFLNECEYITTTVFSDGIDGIDKAGTALSNALETSQGLCSVANSIASILTGSGQLVNPSKLCFSSDDADSIILGISYAKDDLASIQSAVVSAQESLDLLKSTKCDLSILSLSLPMTGCENKLTFLKSEISVFRTGLQTLSQDLHDESKCLEDPPGVVAGGASDIYSDGVLDLEEIRYLMSLPPNMLTPTELAALSSALETIIGEAYAAYPEGSVDEEKLGLLADFLECCYSDFELIAASDDKGLAQASLNAAFYTFTDYLVEHTGQASSSDQKMLATWLQAIKYNASEIVQKVERAASGIGFEVFPPDIKITLVGAGQSMETCFDNCSSGRKYVMSDIASYWDDRDLQFVVSRDTNSATTSYSDFIAADIFIDSSGENPSVRDYFAEMILGEAEDAFDSAADLLGTIYDIASMISDKELSPELIIQIIGFAVGYRDIVNMTDDWEEEIQALKQALEEEKMYLENDGGFNGVLNADGTISYYSYDS